MSGFSLGVKRATKPPWFENVIGDYLVYANRSGCFSVKSARSGPLFRHTGLGAKGKAKGGGKGRPSSSSAQQSTGGAKWITKFEDKGKTRLLCRDYSSAKGCSFPECKFEHLCPVPRPDGRPCLGKHPAYQHKAAPH